MSNTSGASPCHSCSTLNLPSLLTVCAALAGAAATTVFGIEDPRLESGAIAVFSPEADGDVPPIRVISGPRSGLRLASDLAVDRRGYIYVTNSQLRTVDHVVRVFAPDAEGDAAPRRVLEGPNTGLYRPTGLALDRDGRLYVGISRGPSDFPSNAIMVYPAGASGDATPMRTLAGGAYDEMLGPDRLALGRDDSLYAGSAGFLAVFAPGATGATEPARYIVRKVPGPQFATWYSPKLFALDPHDTLYAMSGDTVMVYAPGFSGVEPPVRRIAGPRTEIHHVTDIALDDRGSLYLAQPGPRLNAGRITVYPPGAEGDIPPRRTITGPRTRLMAPRSMAFDRARRLYVAVGVFR